MPERLLTLKTPRPVVGRLAPSPTGLLHLGHARTFLLAWWSARSQHGRVLMRLEDLDGPRVKPGGADAALRDLEWLGLDWDGPVLVQSEGQDRLHGAVDQLVSQGATYPCVCSRADIRAMQSAPQAGVSETRYPGTCRDRFASLEEAERATGREAGLRFRVPDGEVRLDDGFCGPHTCDVQRQIGDFLVARRDKTPSYQLAVVVDDAAQSVTEVVRGNDLLASTPRQWHLQRALDLPHPTWIHVPLVVDETGRRLAKRCDDLSLSQLREAGTDPCAIVAWAASSAGQLTAERSTPSDILPAFDLSALPHRPVVLTARCIEALRSAQS